MREKGWDAAGSIFVVLYAVMLLIIACLSPLIYDEIDSNALPVISLQYRGSLTCNQSDIEQAKIDFKDLYANVNGYEDLRSAKLIKATEDEWVPFYFPIYPLLCIPAKIFLQFLQLDQQRALSITNAVLVAAALVFLQLKLKAKPVQKTVALLMFMASPIVYYIIYVNYEAFIFSMLVIAATLYYNGSRKMSAIFASVAAMANSAVAAICLVMIANYGISVLLEIRKTSIKETVKNYWQETMLYAACFLPCLVPLWFQQYYLKDGYLFAGVASTADLWARFLSYLFDPTLGFTLFAPVTLVLFFIIVALSVVQKRYNVAVWFFMFIAVVAVYSLMPHINSGMEFCARYVVWSYPLVPIAVATYGYECFRRRRTIMALYGLALGSSFMAMMVNPLKSPYEYSNTAEFLLKYTPALYNQYAPVFYCRALNLADGAYGHTEPAYYQDIATGQIYKMIYKADYGQPELVLSQVKGDEATMKYVEGQLKKNSLDGKYHYLNFPSWGKLKLFKKSPIETGEFKIAEVMVEENDFKLLNWGGGTNGAGFPITISPNTYYEIKIVWAEDFDPKQYKTYFIDFFGEGYDGPNQEAKEFAIAGKRDYTFYWNSDDFTGNKDVQVRILTSGEKQAEVSYFSVSRLETAD